MHPRTIGQDSRAHWTMAYAARVIHWWPVPAYGAAALVGTYRGADYADDLGWATVFIAGWWLLRRLPRAAPTIASWADLRFPRFGQRFVTPGATLALAVGLAVLFWCFVGLAAWGLVSLPALVETLSRTSAERGVPLDREAALTVFATAFAAVVALVVVRERRLALRPSEAAVEVSITLALIALALVPVALRMSWVPNLVASVVIPLVVLDVRTFRRRVRSEGERTT